MRTNASTNWIFINVIIIAICFFNFSITEAGPSDGNKKGYISNDTGMKCWYTQEIKENNSYFHENLKGTNAILTFEDPKCMSDTGIGLDINTTMINKTIALWYSHPDAKFKTQASEMYSGSLMQKKGKCIQSARYPIIGITVDYFIKNNSITGVIHGQSVNGCENN